MYDGNGNGTIDIEDFLGILGLFGDVDVDSDGLWDSQDGCSDVEACNYLILSAGICSYPDAIGDCNGNCPVDADGDGICDVYSCNNPVNYQGYDYSTVLIGEQCWFTENLRSENYADSSPILAWISGEGNTTDSGIVGVYGGEGSYECEDDSPDGDACNEQWSLSEYGRLYNWYAVNDERGLCPSGWHVPTNDEWSALTEALGGAPVAGEKMKTTFGWDFGVVTQEAGSGTNSSGFSGLPGGYGIGESWKNAGRYAYFWTSTPDGVMACARILYFQSQGVISQTGPQGALMSIRCIQNTE